MNDTAKMGSSSGSASSVAHPVLHDAVDDTLKTELRVKHPLELRFSVTSARKERAKAQKASCKETLCCEAEELRKEQL